MSRTRLDRFVASGDDAAFEELVREYHPLVYATCLQILGRPSPELDDAVQETFLKLARSASGIHGNLSGWLRTCAHTTAIDRNRSQRVRAHHERGATVERQAAEESPAASIEFAEQRALIRRCVDEMPRRQREVIVAYFFLGQTQHQIAQRLGLSQVAVGKQIAVALTLLKRRCLQRSLGAVALMAVLESKVTAAETATVAARVTSAAKPFALGALRSWLPKAAGACAVAAAVLLVAVHPASLTSPPGASAVAAPVPDPPSALEDDEQWWVQGDGLRERGRGRAVFAPDVDAACRLVERRSWVPDQRPVQIRLRIAPPPDGARFLLEAEALAPDGLGASSRWTEIECRRDGDRTIFSVVVSTGMHLGATVLREDTRLGEGTHELVLRLERETASALVDGRELWHGPFPGAADPVRFAFGTVRAVHADAGEGRLVVEDVRVGSLPPRR